MAKTMLLALRPRGVQSFVVVVSVVDEDDMAFGGARRVLVEHGAKTVDAGVAVEAEGIRDGVPFREEQDRMCGESFHDVPDNDFHFWGENKSNAMPQQGVNRGKPSGESVQEFTIISSSSTA